MKRVRSAAILFALALVSFMPGWAAAAGTPEAASVQHEADSLAAPGLSPTPVESMPEALSGALLVREDDAPAANLHPVPVFLGGRQLLTIRAGRDGMTPEARAAAIRRRLVAAVADSLVSADAVSMTARQNGVEFRLGSHLLFVLISADLPPLDRTETEAWLKTLAGQVREGIARERASQQPSSRLTSVVIGLAITLAAYLLFVLVLVLGRRWRAWLHVAVRPRLPAVQVRGSELLSRRQIGNLVVGVLGRLDLPVLLVFGYAWLTVVFARFPWTQSWSYELRHFALQRLSELASAFASALPGLATVVFILFVFRTLMRISDRFFDRVEHGATTLHGFHPELSRPTRRLARIVLGLSAIIVAYPYLPGAESKAVQGISVLVGLMVSLGSSGVVGNMIAGLVLTYSRSFSIGDRVRIGEHVGDVISLGTFATKLKSLRNEEVTLPNATILGGTILNYTRRAAGEGGLWLHTEVTIGYDAPWRQVHALLIEAARSVAGVEASPEPIVYQRSLNDYHVSYEITCLTHDSHAQLRLYNDLHAAIQDSFARAGVEILSPAYAALRDANAQVLPSEPTGPRARPGGFRVRGPLE